MTYFNGGKGYAGLSMAGQAIPIKGFTVTQQLNAPMTLQAVLAVGKLGIDGFSPADSLTTLEFNRGIKVKLAVAGGMYGDTVNLSEGGVIFSGYLDDSGPSDIASGHFGAEIRAFGNLNRLNLGTLQSPNFVASDLTDFTKPLTNIFGDSAHPLIPFESVNQDPCGALLSALTTLALDHNWTISQTGAALSSVMGEGVNDQAAQLLKAITNQVGTFNGNVIEQVRYWIAHWLNRQIMTDGRTQSFYERLVRTGELLGFVIQESATGIRLLPYTPFVQSQHCKVITSSEYQEVQRQVSNTAQYTGCVLIGSGGTIGATTIGGLYRRATNGDNLVSGLFGSKLLFNVHTGSAITDANATIELGHMLVKDPPPYLYGFSSGIFSDGIGADAATPVLHPDARPMGDAAAREIFLHESYRYRTYLVSVPYIRLDIGAGTAVKVKYPTLPGVDGTFVYGTVESVTITADSEANHASTTYLVRYCRNGARQALEIDSWSAGSHPIFSRTLAGNSFRGDRQEFG